MFPSHTNVQCPNCGQPNTIALDTIIDAEQNPDAKLRLLAGQLNAMNCVACGHLINVTTPLLYHDPENELLMAFVPPELNLDKNQREQAIGDMLRQLDAQLPQEAKRGYLLQPREALTLQGLVEQVLQADGVTPEMMAEQRERVNLIDSFLQASEAELPELVRQHDAAIDAQLFQTMTMMAQRMAQTGQNALVEQIIVVQERLAEYSTFGQELAERGRVQETILQEIAQAVEAMGDDPSIADLLNLTVQYREDEERLQALVGLLRPAFDYAFFQELTLRIGQAPAGERDALEALRERLVQLTAIIDQQTQRALEQAATLLQQLADSHDPDALIQQNLGQIDDTFMAVLTANIEEAERQNNAQAAARFKDIYERVVNVLRNNMPPELQFLNELLAMPSEDEARRKLIAEIGNYGPIMLEMMDAVESVLEARGETELLEKLALLREEAAQSFS
ncbi:MAG: hypothetical protein GYB67_02290 [Chloroflexi bacterium]|nr:hypothetical protein [Chloroflexota bacterium]